jgi:hypothetical protein
MKRWEEKLVAREKIATETFGPLPEDAVKALRRFQAEVKSLGGKRAAHILEIEIQVSAARIEDARKRTDALKAEEVERRVLERRMMRNSIAIILALMGLVILILRLVTFEPPIPSTRPPEPPPQVQQPTASLPKRTRLSSPSTTELPSQQDHTILAPPPLRDQVSVDNARALVRRKRIRRSSNKDTEESARAAIVSLIKAKEEAYAAGDRLKLQSLDQQYQLLVKNYIAKFGDDAWRKFKAGLDQTKP